MYFSCVLILCILTDLCDWVFYSVDINVTNSYCIFWHIFHSAAWWLRLPSDHFWMHWIPLCIPAWVRSAPSEKLYLKSAYSVQQRSKWHICNFKINSIMFCCVCVVSVRPRTAMCTCLCLWEARIKRLMSELVRDSLPYLICLCWSRRRFLSTQSHYGTCCDFLLMHWGQLVFHCVLLDYFTVLPYSDYLYIMNYSLLRLH